VVVFTALGADEDRHDDTVAAATTVQGAILSDTIHVRAAVRPRQRLMGISVRVSGRHQISTMSATSRAGRVAPAGWFVPSLLPL